MLVKILLYSSLLLVTLDILDVNIIQNLTFGKGIVKDPCASRRYKLLSLLNLLCNVTQNTSIVARDACYGCFFRAALLTTGPTLLAQLSQCATIYLNNTVYNVCATQLTMLAQGVRATSAPTVKKCYTGYCEFVQCIRRVNSNQLVDRCLLASIANLNLTTQVSRIALYTNTTSCILAAARCNPYNPITGVFQGYYGLQTTQLSQFTALSNSLQVTPNGDVRVVSFPRNVYAADAFCTSTNALEQATSGICALIT